MKVTFFIDRPVFSAVLSIVIVIIGIIGFDKSDTGAQGFNLIVKAGNLGTVGSIGAFRLGFALLIGFAAQFQQGSIDIGLDTEDFSLELGDLAEVFGFISGSTSHNRDFFTEIIEECHMMFLLGWMKFFCYRMILSQSVRQFKY